MGVYYSEDFQQQKASFCLGKKKKKQKRLGQVYLPPAHSFNFISFVLCVPLHRISISWETEIGIIEYLKLEEIHKDHQVQLCAPCRTT